MRVLFFQPIDEQETAEFLALERKVAAFWRQFQKVCHSPPSVWLADVRRALKDMNPALGFEIEVTRAGERVLGSSGEHPSREQPAETFAYVISLEGPAYKPLAQAVVDKAPAVWPWVIASEREPVELASALHRVFTDTRFDLKAARARVGVGRGHGIEVVIGHHLFHGTQDETGGQVGEQLVTTLLGDDVFDNWVTSVEVVAAPRPSPLRLVGQEASGLPLGVAEVQAAVANAIKRISDSLPEAPLHEFCDRADWVLFEMDELRAGEDAAQWPLPDLHMATTMCPEMLKSYLTGIPFSSRRFSRHGERFVYLDLANDGSPEAERLEQRMALEESLDYALVPGRLGCVVGAGVGSDHMYVFLALHNVKAGLAALNRCLLSQPLSFRARLHFCDDEWAMEWVEIQRLASE